MEEIEAICQKIAIVDQGQVLAEGTLTDILHSPEPLLDIGLEQPLPKAIAQRYSATLIGEQKYRLILPLTVTIQNLLDELVSEGCRVRNLNYGQHDLEQVFMRLTNRSLRD
jgi:ABC-2 type transport system ATP-binding protein